MRTNPNTLDSAVQALDELAATFQNPHWTVHRLSSGYEIDVYLPRVYANQPGVRSVSDFCVAGAKGPDLLTAVTAMLEILSNLPVGDETVLDVLAAEMVA